MDQLREQEAKERQEKIDSLKREIRELELSIEPFKDISLLNVEVYHKTYGVGIIVKQNINQVTIKFENEEKIFSIHKKFSKRPTFENDDEVVEAFTTYADSVSKIEKLEQELKRIS